MKKDLLKKIKPKLSESNQELIEMALLFKELNEEQRYYIAVLSEGMLLSNKLSKQC